MSELDRNYPEVDGFAKIMKQVLEENAHKGHWGKDTPESLAEHLQEEVDEVWAELHDPVEYRDVKRIIRECADVANMAMMIADVVSKFERLKKG